MHEASGVKRQNLGVMENSNDASRNTLHWIRPFNLIEGHLHRVQVLINEQLTAKSLDHGHSSVVAGTKTGELLDYLRNNTGKMIRPGLVLLAGACFKNITESHIRVAAIIEMIHNATLLHDDVIDNGQQRRSMPTVNHLWGNESAVLLGDFLLSRVFSLSAELKPRAAKMIASAAVRVCQGELQQIEQKQNWQLSESEYIDIITEKSAVLFSCCCSLGAILAGAGESAIYMFSNFGLNAGIAFQITDDLLDILGDEKQTGKTSGCDLADNKLTLPLIHLLNSVNPEKREQIKSLFDVQDSSLWFEKRKSFIDLLNDSGSIDYAQGRASDYLMAAIQSISDIKSSDAKKALIETAEFMTRRTK
jgi:octaprenyl-diphosphate synthase